MKALVTGGAGFIGSHLVNYLLKRGHTVTVVDDLSGGPVPGFKGDCKVVCERIEDMAPGRLDCIDCVYHLAAYPAEAFSIFSPSLMVSRNLLSTTRLISEAIRSGVGRVVFISSVAVYGISNTPPFVESMTLDPSDPYGITKAAGEQLFRVYNESHGLPYCILRLHNVYGPRQNMCDPYRNVVAIFLRQALEDRDITVFGKGDQLRSFTYIDDIIPYIARAGEAPEAASQIINLGAAHPYSINDLIGIIEAVIGRRLSIRRLPARLGDGEYIASDVKKAEKILRFRDATSLKCGIENMLDWASSQKHMPRKWRHSDVEITVGLPESWR